MRVELGALAACIVAACIPGAADSVPPKDALRIGMMAGVPEKWNTEANFRVFLQRLDEAHRQGVELFITPECWLDGYAAPDQTSTPERLRAIAHDPRTSPYLRRVSEEARVRGMYICLGFTSVEGEQIYNAAGFWDDQGQLIGLYHKTHLQTHDLQYSLGLALPVWPTPWGPMGIVICADRRWPESIRALRLQGARLILNPTYGFHGEVNTAIMRTRGFENQCFVAFTHPQESLITTPRGGVQFQRGGDEGWVAVCDLDLSRSTWSNHLPDRRPELYATLALPVAQALPDTPPEGYMRVAAAQFASGFDVAFNTERIVATMRDAAWNHVRVVAFPEMALTGYDKDQAFIDRLDWTAVDAGLQRIREACTELGLYVIVGAPTREDGAAYCAAIAIGPDGKVLDAYEKIYRAGEKWASAGRKLSTFKIDGILCGTFICHDERYAPLVQLRALAGTQLFFYISCESGLEAIGKMAPYRAQIQARAVENNVFIVHANTPSAFGRVQPPGTSHGESRIIDTKGNILREAPIHGEALVIADLDIAHAKRGGMAAALTEGPLSAWMQEGLKYVQEPSE